MPDKEGMNKNDGERAFPLAAPNGHVSDGMSLRDWFAGKAMQGIISSPNSKPELSDKDMCRICYGIADAMLTEREKSK